MAGEWRTHTLGELTVNYDGKRRPVRGADRKPGPYPYYGASGIVDYVDDYLIDGDYLLIAEDGENLRTRQTPIAFMARGKSWVNNHAHIVTGNDKADTRFLMYSLQAADIGAYLTGAVMPKLTQGNLNRIPISCPLLDEQRAIAHILGTLDDKIELNRLMSETLEAMARLLFESWFVNFDPVRANASGEQTESICRRLGLTPNLLAIFPDSFQDSELGKIPQGWEVTSIGTVAEVIDCLHAKKPRRRDAGKPLLQLTNIRNDGLIDMEDIYLIDQTDYQKWVSRMEASPGDCVITNVGRVGAAAQMPVGQKAALGRNMTGVRCKSEFPFPTTLIECLLSQAMKDEIALKVDAGTILEALNVRNIPRLRFVRPRKNEILEYFEQQVRPLRAQMENHLAETITLAALRDTLLQKLLSGELRVPLTGAA